MEKFELTRFGDWISYEQLDANKQKMLNKASGPLRQDKSDAAAEKMLYADIIEVIDRTFWIWAHERANPVAGSGTLGRQAKVRAFLRAIRNACLKYRDIPREQWLLLQEALSKSEVDPSSVHIQMDIIDRLTRSSLKTLQGMTYRVRGRPEDVHGKYHLDDIISSWEFWKGEPANTKKEPGTLRGYIESLEEIHMDASQNSLTPSYEASALFRVPGRTRRVRVVIETVEFGRSEWTHVATTLHTLIKGRDGVVPVSDCND